jgi:alkylated DNA repair protein (DNA oxidative demethylase)
VIEPQDRIAQRKARRLAAKANKGDERAAMNLPSNNAGLRLYPGHLDQTAQQGLLAAVRGIFEAAPLFTPRMPKSGRPFTVRMSNCGPLGWVSDENGYRYQPTHPDTAAPWPPMPTSLLALWSALARYPQPPQACLINLYAPSAKMGLHQDRDEADFDAPVISISLGDSCLFRVGGQKRSEPTQSIRLSSGDVVVLGGAARLAFHGVDRIYPGTSRLLPEGGRINLTLRRVTRSTSDTRHPRAPESSHDEP